MASVPRAAFAPAPQTGSLREAIEDRIAVAIVSGALAPGELVTVPALAAEFEVSATPVREAMLNLAKIGFVDPVRNKGFRVTEVSVRDLEEIVELRRMLEVPIVAKLAGAFPDAEYARLRGIAERIVAASDRSDLIDYVAADIDFHRELLALAGNARLVETVTALRRQTRLTGLRGMSGSAELDESAREHLRLLDLVRDGDAEGAAALMHRHVGHVLGWWSGHEESDEDSVSKDHELGSKVDRTASAQ